MSNVSRQIFKIYHSVFFLFHIYESKDSMPLQEKHSKIDITLKYMVVKEIIEIARFTIYLTM